MASITISDFVIADTPIQVYDGLGLKQDKSGSAADKKWKPDDIIGITQYHSSFRTITGPKPTHSLLLSSLSTSQNAFFHSACVHVPSKGELYATSKPLQATDASRLPIILISRVKLSLDDGTGELRSVEWTKLRPPPNIPMPAGAVLRRSPSGPHGGVEEEGILFCSQGSPAPGTGGLFQMPLGRPPRPLVTNFYGRDFNSPRSAVVSRSGQVWFTDPCGGFDLEFRPKPQLPCHVYCFDPERNELRAVADGYGRPAGLAFNPEESILYVTDTEAGVAEDSTQPASIYAHDVLVRSGGLFLANKRLFAHALQGLPLDIKCDSEGNVWAGCGDGLEVWSANGTLLGVVEVPGGVSAFCFGSHNDVFLCSDQRLWRVRFTQEVDRLL